MRYLPMYELFLGDALKKRGVEEVYIHTLMADEPFSSLTETLNHSDGPVLFWESLSSKSVGYISNGMDFCGYFKSRTHRPLFLGGYWASTVAKEFNEFEMFDYIIQGYGFEAVVDHLLSPEPAGHYLDAHSPCDWNAHDLALDCLVSPEKYYRESEKFLTGYISSFACPNKCGFCYNTVLKSLDSDYWARDLDKVFADLDKLDELYGFERIQLKDLNFFYETERAFAILDYLQENGKKCQRGLDLHVQDASEELFQRMSKYGVSEIWIGLEAFSRTELARMDKEYDTSKVERIFAWGGKYGIEVYGNIMLGAPWQTRESVEVMIARALEIINTHSNARIMFNAMRPVMGSPIQVKYFPDVARGRSFNDMVEMFAFRLNKNQNEVYGEDFDFIDIEKTYKAFFLINRFASIGMHSGAVGKWFMRQLSRLVQTQLKPPFFSFSPFGKFFLYTPDQYTGLLVFLRTLFIEGNRKKWMRSTLNRLLGPRRCDGHG